MKPSMKNAGEYVDQNFTSSITVSDLAKITGLSYATTCRHFRAAFGESFMTRIHRLRVDLAKKYLEERPDRVDEIAMLVGFGSPVQFHRCFLKLTGTTPMQYRKELWQLNQPRILGDP